MQEVLESVPVIIDGDLKDRLVHEICDCSPDIGVCGAPLAMVDPYPAGAVETSCVVCADMSHYPCPRCGAH